MDKLALFFSLPMTHGIMETVSLCFLSLNMKKVVKKGTRKVFHEREK